MSFISLNIPEREINLHFVNSAGLQKNAPFCVLLKKKYSGGGKPPRPLPTTFSLSRVGMYDNVYRKLSLPKLSFYQHLYRIYNKHRIITKAVKLGNFSIKLDISVDGINFVSLNSHRYYA